MHGVEWPLWGYACQRRTPLIHETPPDVCRAQRDSGVTRSVTRFARGTARAIDVFATDTNLGKHGVYKEKRTYGRTFTGIERTTFVIDTAGTIQRIYPKVKVEKHAEAVLEFVRSLR